MIHVRPCIAALCLAAVAAPALAEAPRFPVPGTSRIGTVRFISEEDPGAVIGGVQIFVAAGLDREPVASPGVASLLAEAILRTPVASEGRSRPLRDAIASMGSVLTYAVDGRATHFYVQGRGSDLPRAVELLGTALAHPDFSGPTVAAGAAFLATRIADVESNPLSVGLEMFKHVYYQGAAGRPVDGTAETLAALTPTDLRRFYEAAYRRSGLTFAYAGRAAPGLGASLAKVAASLPAGPLAAPNQSVTAIPATSTHVIAQRAVGAPFVVVGFAAPAPMSSDYGPMLVLEALIEQTFNADLTTTAGIAQRRVGALYLYDASPASLAIYVNGLRTDATAGLNEVLVLTRALAQNTLPEPELAKMRTIAAGRFDTQAVTLGDRSYLLGSLASQGLGPDGMNASLAAIAKVTPADVRRVAKTYLERYVVSIVLPRATAPAAE